MNAIISVSNLKLILNETSPEIQPHFMYASSYFAFSYYTIIYGHILKANLSWSPNWSENYAVNCKFICGATPT